MVIFHSYVCLPEGMLNYQSLNAHLQNIGMKIWSVIPQGPCAQTSHGVFLVLKMDISPREPHVHRLSFARTSSICWLTLWKFNIATSMENGSCLGDYRDFPQLC